MSGTSAKPDGVGIVGLGIMGSAFASHLRTAGHRVVGFDPDEARVRDARRNGVEIRESARGVAGEVDCILTSLPSEPALVATVDAILGASPRRMIVVELSTLSIECKTEQQARLSGTGVRMLDCPVSGTGAQAVVRDIVLFVSGDADAYAQVTPVLGELSREAVYLGAFGNGMRMKIVANLLVAIHNVAAAEAILLGVKAGLDPQRLIKVLASSAGTSRMLELRGPMMVRHSYEPATMKLDMWDKDMRLIAAFAQGLGVPTPLFSATAPLYRDALERGFGAQDTAAVYAVLRNESQSGN